MLLVARLEAVADPDALTAEASAALAALASRPGWVGGRLARSLDDPGCWVVVCEWAEVGSGRRGLTTGAVRAAIMPLMSRLGEGSLTFEILCSA